MRTGKSGENYGVARLIERQMSWRSVRETTAPTPKPAVSAGPYRFLTVSRQLGSLGGDITQELARRLGWHVFDREIVEYIASHRHVRQRLVEDLDEKSQSLIQDTVRRLLEMVEGGGLGIEEYHEALVHTLVSLATRGQAILVGRGANFVLRSQPGLHLRFVGSTEIRLRRLRERWGMSPREARTRMEQADRERAEFIRRHFKADADDPSFYDLLLNTDQLTVERCVSAVLSLFK